MDFGTNYHENSDEFKGLNFLRESGQSTDYYTTRNNQSLKMMQTLSPERGRNGIMSPSALYEKQEQKKSRVKTNALHSK